MYVGNLKQWEKEIPYVPAGLARWIEKLASYDLASLAPGRHDLGDGNYMNVDVGETHPASERTMEAHREYIDIQTVSTSTSRRSLKAMKLSAISPFATPAPSWKTARRPMPGFIIPALAKIR